MRWWERPSEYPRLTTYFLSGMSGLLLFLADFPVHAWPLQAVALLPWLLALVRLRPGLWTGLGAGFCLGLFYTGPLVLALQFPLELGAGLALYLTLLWALLSLGAAYLLRGSPLLGVLGVGALAVVLEWVDISLVPVWGTAQVFTRVWSASPWAIQLVSVTGVTGLVFVLVTAQGLMATALVHPKSQRRAAIALVVLLGVVAAVNTALWPTSSKRKVRVATVGWTFEQLPRGRQSSWKLIYDTVYTRLVRRAAARGAKLVVSPEAAFRIHPHQRRAFARELSQTARSHRIWLAVGYFDKARDRNQIVFVDDRGRRRGEYSKTHLIMTLEKYKAGDGSLVTLKGPGFSLGGMICQDDNFTDLSRGYGRKGVQVLAVPTNDWRQVRNYHLENSRFRAVESRYAVVRAASNGISAIITARGEVLARRDHFTEGPGALVVDLPLYESGSFYSRAGNWPVIFCLLLLLLGQAWTWRHRLRRGRAAGKNRATT